MKNATPTETANYITNTGCEFEWREKNHAPWYIWREQASLKEVLSRGYQIRIALTPFGLPSHLEPHNPAGLSAEQITEGGKYRCGVLGDAIKCADGYEFWNGKEWLPGILSVGKVIEKSHYTYRLPADTPFPDWEEMSKGACKTCEGTGEVPCTDIHPLEESQPCPDCKATVKESLTVQPATEESSAAQPAPGETPETDAEYWRCNPVGQWNDGKIPADFARTLERQRDQAQLQADFFEAAERTEKKRAVELQAELATANADRVRLREVINGALCECGDGHVCVTCQALSTPPPEMVSKAEHAKILEEYDRMEKTLIACASDSAAVMVNMMRGTIAPLSLEQWLSLNGLEHPPGYVSKAEHDALKKRFDQLETEKLYGMQEMNDRLIDRTSGMLDGQVRMRQMPSPMSFRAGWEAMKTKGATQNVEKSLREHMAENEPKGKTLAELKGGEG